MATVLGQVPRQPLPQPSVSSRARVPTRSRTRGVFWYLLIAFGLPWSLWLPLGLLGASSSSLIYQVGVLDASFAPAVAAIIVRRWITREGFGDAGLRPHLRTKWRYYLVAGLWPFALFGPVFGVANLLGMPLVKDLSVSIVGTMGLVLLYTLYFWGEEFGWRGYLQLRLYRDRPLLACVVTGAIWGVWHIPMAAGGVTNNEHGLLSLLLLPWFPLTVSVLLGWLQLRTGSVWAPSLAHAANNFLVPAMGASLLAGSPGMGDLPLSARGLLVVAAMLLLGGAVALGGMRRRPACEEHQS